MNQATVIMIALGVVSVVMCYVQMHYAFIIKAKTAQDLRALLLFQLAALAAVAAFIYVAIVGITA